MPGHREHIGRIDPGLNGPIRSFTPEGHFGPSAPPYGAHVNARPAHAWPPTTRQWVAGAVGLAIGLAGVGTGSALSVAVRLPGYPVACMAIVTFVGIVGDRRTRWFIAHELAMGAIVVGWLLADRPEAAMFNAAWLVSAALWYLIGGRRAVERA